MLFFLHHVDPLQPQLQPHTTERHKSRQMDVTIKDFADNSHVIEVGVDDTTETMRQKVATAVGLAEGSFRMGFGGKDEAAEQLSAGDTIILTKTKKQQAIVELHALGVTDITAEKLESVQDPEVACLLLQAEVATVIPNDFLARTSLTRLDLSAESIVTHIGDCFLADCDSLASVDLSGLSNVTRVGADFLQNCWRLAILDLSVLNNVTKVGDSFLFGCKSLTTLNLSPLSNVTHISTGFAGTTYFAENCTSLTSIYLSGCSSVVSNEVRKGELSKLVVEARPKRSRDESPEQSQK